MKECCRTILVVEDDDAIRMTLTELLELEGYKVREASNGKEGLEVLPQIGETCLILLDLMMPVMNGWEFLKAKKDQVRVAPIPVVILSAIESEKGSYPGAANYIKKPIQIDTLLKVVSDYCGNSD